MQIPNAPAVDNIYTCEESSTFTQINNNKKITSHLVLEIDK